MVTLMVVQRVSSARKDYKATEVVASNAAVGWSLRCGRKKLSRPGARLVTSAWLAKSPRLMKTSLQSPTRKIMPANRDAEGLGPSGSSQFRPTMYALTTPFAWAGRSGKLVQICERWFQRIVSMVLGSLLNWPSGPLMPADGGVYTSFAPIGNALEWAID